MTAAVVILLSGSLSASAASGDVLVKDHLGDGRPDIVRMNIEHGPAVAARVTVRVRNVRASDNPELTLFVDPTGHRSRPTYAIVLGISDGGDWLMRRTEGWRLRRNAGTCGERIRLRFPAPQVRVVVFKMPYACFGDVGAKFAVRTSAYTNQLKPVGTPDWAPAKRTLSRRFNF